MVRAASATVVSGVDELRRAVQQRADGAGAHVREVALGARRLREPRAQRPGDEHDAVGTAEHVQGVFAGDAVEQAVFARPRGELRRLAGEQRGVAEHLAAGEHVDDEVVLHEFHGAVADHVQLGARGAALAKHDVAGATAAASTALRRRPPDAGGRDPGRGRCARGSAPPRRGCLRCCRLRAWSSSAQYRRVPAPAAARRAANLGRRGRPIVAEARALCRRARYCERVAGALLSRPCITPAPHSASRATASRRSATSSGRCCAGPAAT